MDPIGPRIAIVLPRLRISNRLFFISTALIYSLNRSLASELLGLDDSGLATFLVRASAVFDTVLFIDVFMAAFLETIFLGVSFTGFSVASAVFADFFNIGAFIAITPKTTHLG